MADSFHKRWTNEDVKKLWAQANRELQGFANALDRGNSGLTAAQLRMALQLANEAAVDIHGLCNWCLEGFEPIRSSVSEAFVHTDTPVGRRVCTSEVALKD